MPNEQTSVVDPDRPLTDEEHARAMQIGIRAIHALRNRAPRGDGTNLNRDAYERMIREDLVYLEQQPQTLERIHIANVLLWSIDALYGAKP